MHPECLQNSQIFTIQLKPGIYTFIALAYPYAHDLAGRPVRAGTFCGYFMDVLQLVIIPIFLSVLFHHFFSKRAKWIDKVMPRVSMAGIALIIVVITAAGARNLLHVGFLLIGAMFLHMTTGLLLGYWGARLFGLPENDCRTVGIEVGMQNGGLASGIAAQMGKIATVGLAPAVNGPVMNTTFSLIATWWGGGL